MTKLVVGWEAIIGKNTWIKHRRRKHKEACRLDEARKVEWPTGTRVLGSFNVSRHTSKPHPHVWCCEAVSKPPVSLWWEAFGPSILCISMVCTQTLRVVWELQLPKTSSMHNAIWLANANHLATAIISGFCLARVICEAQSSKPWAFCSTLAFCRFLLVSLKKLLFWEWVWVVSFTLHVRINHGQAETRTNKVLGTSPS